MNQNQYRYELQLFNDKRYAICDSHKFIYLLKVLITEPEERCKKPESFCCSICAGVSAKTVLYVCESGHVVCDTCRKSGTFQCIFIIFHYFYLFFYKVKQSG